MSLQSQQRWLNRERRLLTIWGAIDIALVVVLMAIVISGVKL